MKGNIELQFLPVPIHSGEQDVADLLAEALEEDEQADLKLSEETDKAIMPEGPEAPAGGEENGNGGASSGSRKAAA